MTAPQKPEPLTDDEAVCEVAWVAHEALALIIDDEPWLSSDSPERVAWLARRDEYAARKLALRAYIETAR